MGQAVAVRTDYTASEVRRLGSSDAAGLGDPVQSSGAGRSLQHAFARRAAQARCHAPGLSGPHRGGRAIPAVHGVVRWRACDLIMRLHEEFEVSVSDDTIYRALKDVGFSHVSARPTPYQHAPEAIDPFKKTSASAWPKPERGSRRTHR